MNSESITAVCPKCGAKNRIPRERRGDRLLCGKCRASLPVVSTHVSWPTGQEYAEAIQNPRILFADSALRDSTPALDRLGMPIVSAGNFAYVFKVRLPNGERAIRCFSRYMGDRAQRYQAIDAHLDKVRVPSFAEFEYDSDGILVLGQRLPLLVMEWISGDTLDVYVNEVIGKKGVLKYVAEEWVKLIKSLENAVIAHGDLQHGNIIVQGTQLRLVDFDGVYVSEIANLNACELGHRNYQHPARSLSDFNLKLDNFSALVIYLSLISLEEQPSLWEAFHNGENLIFTREDYIDPFHSRVFAQVRKIGGEARRFSEYLSKACCGPLQDTPKLAELVEVKATKLPSWMRGVPEAATVKPKTREVPITTAPPSTAVKPKPGPPIDKTFGQPIPLPPNPVIITAPPKPIINWGQWWKTSFKYTLLIGLCGLLGSFIWIPVLKEILVGVLGISRKDPDLPTATFILYVLICLPIGMRLAYKKLIKPATPKYTPASQPGYSAPIPPTTPPHKSSPPSTPSRKGSSGSVLVGSKIRLIYHRPTCEWALKIGHRNRTSFSSSTAARKSGYRPCRVCHPG